VDHRDPVEISQIQCLSSMTWTVDCFRFQGFRTLSAHGPTLLWTLDQYFALQDLKGATHCTLICTLPIPVVRLFSCTSVRYARRTSHQSPVRCVQALNFHVV